MNIPILQTHLPSDMRTSRRLPGIQPLIDGDWLRVDEAYAGQMAERGRLMVQHHDAVHWLDPEALPAAQELLETTLAQLSDLGFEVEGDHVTTPDGRKVCVSHTMPLLSLGALVQEDFCLLQKRGNEHVLTGAILCFPASWRLAEKVGRPLTAIHDPVPEYDGNLAARVQRMFDGVKVGRPLWRFNQLWYDDPSLHQPRSVVSPREIREGPGEAQYYRSERQCIFRLPETQAVVFSIHTYVLDRASVA
ncbi:hypothetical protein ASD8599_01575 [Ascidiaceihabitans donghaensis]|uniref:DUF3445 domain-containing protein n=1 Tax=Ascidiaceihabitans donghaensis TaxID=1510460 RepID=A0A2R8BCM3_9RHOB|nr:DUF3445 domain-containing protein [Ascidiaceihabitans donghaensis]SPH20834.1 hypothetical protein ASD8599_01575 [Ascidiaceihabitans donghaensis]